MATESTRPIMNNILGKYAIGNTPMVRLDRIAKANGLKCNLLGKIEFFNAGGSVKDRIAKRMVEKAEEDGALIPGKSIVIEPTSGNTGIGLALACALKGYPVIITLPEKMSLEKEVTLRALGAEIVRTPTEAPSTSPESNIGVAERLKHLIPGGVVLDQYNNPHNPEAHEFGTGSEIVEQVVTAGALGEKGILGVNSGKVDLFFAGAGTGGTLTGCSRAIKKHNSAAKVVAIDPKGSIAARPESLNVIPPGESGAYYVEGIGYDFIPGTLDHTNVDEWVKTQDDESWEGVLQLMKLEGLLVGGSSGAALAGAMRWLKSEEGFKAYGGVEGQNVVILFADGIRNYMSKPWFKGTLDEQEPTPLAHQIASALGKPAPMSKKATAAAATSNLTSMLPPTISGSIDQLVGKVEKMFVGVEK
ncbi:PALP-domain-containing protein [Clavulina sp. PMI_390]|nr:PALP-domain-containing protein [Clavulina sp. PMI_390]